MASGVLRNPAYGYDAYPSAGKKPLPSQNTSCYLRTILYYAHRLFNNAAGI
jgi:hypothetical protein